MSEVNLTVSTLFGKGPTDVSGHVYKLVEIKKKYSAWVTKKIALDLTSFENAIMKISSLSILIADINTPDRSNLITE